MKKLILSALVIGGAISANAVVLFDSGGFETYTNGALSGQNGWVLDGTANYQVQSTLALGTKAVAVAGGAGTSWIYPDVTYTPSSGELVKINASIARTAGTSFGYSIDVYNTLTARTTRFGLTMSAGAIRPYVTSRFNGTTLQFDAASAVTNVLVGPAVSASTFVDFEAVLNYSTKKLDLKVNGTSVTGGSTIPFADLTASNISDADFQVSTATGATDTGYLDNYRVEVVPEPASMTALALGVAALARKRRKA